MCVFNTIYAFFRRPVAAAGWPSGARSWARGRGRARASGGGRRWRAAVSGGGWRAVMREEVVERVDMATVGGVYEAGVIGVRENVLRV